MNGNIIQTYIWIILDMFIFQDIKDFSFIIHKTASSRKKWCHSQSSHRWICHICVPRDGSLGPWWWLVSSLLPGMMMEDPSLCTRYFLIVVDGYSWMITDYFRGTPMDIYVFFSMDMYRCLLIYGCLRRYEEHPWYFPGFLCLKEGCPGGFLWGANLPWVSVFRGELNIFSPTSWSIILLGIKDGNGISTGYRMISYDIMINGGV